MDVFCAKSTRAVLAIVPMATHGELDIESFTGFSQFGHRRFGTKDLKNSPLALLSFLYRTHSWQ